MVRILPYQQPQIITEFRDEFSRLMDQFLNRDLFSEGGEVDVWMRPSADVAETEDRYEICMELPGFAPEEVKIEVDSGNLYISGQHREEREKRGKTWHRAERRFGQFRRSFSLGDVQPDQVQADFRNGVLRVSVPKGEGRRRRRIEIRSSQSGPQTAEVGRAGAKSEGQAEATQEQPQPS